MSAEPDLTSILRRFQAGEEAAADELVPLVHAELHRLAHRALSRLPAGQTLQTTALLNEAWLKMGKGESADFNGREHFLAIAASAMRSIVVDRARMRGAQRRGGGFKRVDLDDVVDVFEEGAADLIALDAALDELAALRPELARVVELRFFAGMSHPEVAKVQGVPLRRIERDWSAARAWLYDRLMHDEGQR